jgi:multisubunit Na+/H+ antiporter MnhB subunit
VRGTLTQAVARLILLPGVAIAAATLVKGYSEVGDGFTAGVIAALTVLVQCVAFGYREAERRLPLLRWLPAGAVAGLTIALAVALVPVARGDAILEHAPAAGERPVQLGTLELVTAVLFDVGVFLVVLGAIVGAAGAIARATHQEGT